MKVSETLVPRLLLVTNSSRSESESVRTIVLPSVSLLEVPPVIRNTSSVVPLVRLMKVGLNEARETRSDISSVTVPLLRSRVKLLRLGGLISGMKFPGRIALPSVIAKTSTPNMSSMP